MSSVKTIYFSDEANELLEKVENVSGLICELIIKQFSNDEEILRERVLSGERELNRLKATLQDKVDERLKRETRMRERNNTDNASIERRKLTEQFFALWQDNKITDDEYWSCFPEKKEPLYNKMKEIMKK